MTARFQVSLQAKVLMAVLSLLILLPAVMLWTVDRRITQQTRDDAGRALLMARTVTLQSLKNRSESLIARYRSAVNDSRFLRIVRLPDAVSTLRSYLAELLEEFSDDTETIAYFGSDEALVTGTRRGTSFALDELARASAPVVHSAASGQIASSTLTLGDQIFNIVAVPVRLPENDIAGMPENGIAGVLLIGVLLEEPALERIKPPGTEMAIVTDNGMTLSTLKGAEPMALNVTRPLPDDLMDDVNGVRGTLIDGEHYLVVAGARHYAARGNGFRAVLFSSYELQLKTLAETRLTLIGLSVAGIVISATVVWFFVRRITRPLRELRDNAEAVGRGDFSRRIERISNDECGELAVAFNQMTTNLQASRAELEGAMQTVKSTQEQLIQSEKLSAVGQFVAGVAHELNNPLTAVIGFSELLQSMETEPKVHGHLERIARSAHRCHKIVHSLLSFARQEAPERKLVGLHGIVDEVLEIMAYDLRTSNVTVVREFATSLPPIMADPHQLQQVFVNILGNARQAIEPYQREGRITIRTHADEGWITLEFEDNGPGIRAEHLARIFDPFFTTKPAGKGTGLGLSLSYGLIQEHGGRISARSEVGHGAAFVIELPVAASAMPPTLRRSGTPWPFPQDGRPSGKTVLVVDDEEWILDLAGELLSSDGHTVQTANNGQKALELLSRQKFDVIVSDWKMPGLNGIRLYEHLAETNPEMAKKMFFMTGDVMSDTFQAFLQQNQLACLSKPFAIVEFRAAIARMFRKTM